MAITSRLEQLENEIASAQKHFSEVRELNWQAAASRFREGGGCARCMGTGYYQAYFTLDYMGGESMPCDVPGCTAETRAATYPLLRATDAEMDALTAADQRLREARDRLEDELDRLEVRRGRLVRVVKGRKVAYGVYRCIWEGATKFGRRVGLLPIDAVETNRRVVGGYERSDWKSPTAKEPAWTSADNCVALQVCPCGACGKSEELDVAAAVRPEWLDWDGGTVRNLARTIRDLKAFDRMPILADALEEAGCDDPALLTHLRLPRVSPVTNPVAFDRCSVLDQLAG